MFTNTRPQLFILLKGNESFTRNQKLAYETQLLGCISMIQLLYFNHSKQTIKRKIHQYTVSLTTWPLLFVVSYSGTKLLSATRHFSFFFFFFGIFKYKIIMNSSNAQFFNRESRPTQSMCSAQERLKFFWVQVVKFQIALGTM